MPNYGVAWHISWGEVGGQLFDDERSAKERFAELNGGGCAAILVGPDGKELQYYGCRGGREDEMMQWWFNSTSSKDVKQVSSRCANGYPQVDKFEVVKVYSDNKPAPIDCLVIGAGSRGCVYAAHPELRPVAVADPNVARRVKFAKRHAISAECQFSNWQDAIAAAQAAFTADVCIVATPDQLHVGPALAACQHFRGLLLEKPMAVTEEDCETIAAACKEHGTICAICHVLRYNFANTKIRELIRNGAVGEVMTINHTEPVGYFHFAHSFVRGNWRNESESTNSLLAKCCHDVDLIASWMGHDRCVSVSSFGNLQHFRTAKKPKEAQSATRCLECPIKETCAYSATRLYLDPTQSAWARHLVDDVMDIESLTEALQTGPYGRCVYECDNDVCDHQIVNFLFESGATANLTMIATSERLCERETKVYGSAGELSTSDPFLVRHYDFSSRKVTEHRPDDSASEQAAILGEHGGADGLLVNAFVHAVRSDEKGYVLTGPDESLASHRLAFMADRSRKLQQVIAL